MFTLSWSLTRLMRSLVIGCAVVLLATVAVGQNRNSSRGRNPSQRQESPQRQEPPQGQEQPERQEPPPDQNRTSTRITEYPPHDAQGSVKIAFEVISGASKRRVRVKVECTGDAVTSKQIDFSSDGDHSIVVNLFKGNNSIEIIGFANDKPASLGTFNNINCSSRWCHEPYSLTPDTVAHELKESAETPAPDRNEGAERGQHEEASSAQSQQAAAPTEGEGAAEPEEPKAITIDKPTSPFTVNDVASVDSYVTVGKKSGIAKIQYQVLNDGKTVFTSETYDVAPTDEKSYEVRIRTKILKGLNTIRFFDADHPEKHEAFVKVTCEGDNCATNLLVAAYPSNSQNTRAVVGFEQVGASSTTSKTKPFLDFFFTSPLIFHKDEEVPRLAAWGQIRLATTPDQIGSAAVLPSNLVTEVSKSGRAELVQSFDFLAGLEGRVKSANGNFLSLIPGIRQRTHFYLAGGGGAISPLTAERELAQIFKIPTENSPQRQLFIDRYGTPPAPIGDSPAKEFVGLVPLDRDRFLRQWYVGMRLKTLYCENTECTRFMNRFPGTFDLMFGQNEAVTGGSLKYNVTDPNDKTKIIGQKNSYVIRLDAFYPFPIKEASFLYLFGNAMMKIGGGGVSVQNPLFLDRAAGDVSITDPKVYIPPTDRQKLLQPNRDYYKIGVGVNLTDLFNRNKN